MFSAVRLASTQIARRGAAASSRMAFTTMARQPQQLYRKPQVFTQMRYFAAPTFLDKNDVMDRVLDVVKNFDQVDPSKVSPETKFSDDLGLDSLDVVEVVMAIEDEFAVEIPDAEADKIASISEAVDYIASHPMAK